MPLPSILIGTSTEIKSANPDSFPELLYDDSKGSVITFAGQQAPIPTLLTYSGSIIVFDPLGEYYRVSARARRDMGQRVVRLDPFNVLHADAADTFNPFDVFRFTNSIVNDEIHSLINSMDVKDFNSEQIWRERAIDLLVAVALYLATQEPEDCHLTGLRSKMFSDDVVYNLAVLLDTRGKTMEPQSYQSISGFLQCLDRDRSGILAMAQEILSDFGSPTVARVTNATSFDLDAYYQGEHNSIYIAIPPTKSSSYRRLPSLWLAALLLLIENRKTSVNTLLLLGHAAQLGRFSLLSTAHNLMGTCGIRLWSIWDTPSQLQATYPTEWGTLVSNSSVIQAFGRLNTVLSNQLVPILGVAASDLGDIASNEQVVSIDGSVPFRAKQIDYEHHARFQNLFDTVG